MDWTAIGVIISIVVMLGSLNLYLHSSLKDEMERRFDRLDNDVKSIDRRLSHLEGAFQERGYWESRKTGTDEKKG